MENDGMTYYYNDVGTYIYRYNSVHITIITRGHVDIYLFVNISRQYLYMCRAWLVSSYAVHYRSSRTILDGLWRTIKTLSHLIVYIPIALTWENT